MRKRTSIDIEHDTPGWPSWKSLATLLEAMFGKGTIVTITSRRLDNEPHEAISTYGGDTQDKHEHNDYELPF